MFSLKPRSTAAQFFDAVKNLYRRDERPVALQFLQDFKGTVARMDKFRLLPSDGEKYVYWLNNGPWPDRAIMGIPDGWVNAVDYEGLINGKPVRFYRGGPATFTWGNGSPPNYYVPLGPWPYGDARHTLEKYLLDVSKGSAYLRGLGLTSDAIAAAADVGQ